MREQTAQPQTTEAQPKAVRPTEHPERVQQAAPKRQPIPIACDCGHD